MAIPFYQGLRQHYADAGITLLGPKEVFGVLPSNCFNDTIELDSQVRRSWKGLQGYAKQLRAECFDLALSLPASASAAFLFWLAAIPNRVGFGEGGSLLFQTYTLKWPGFLSGQHKTKLYFELLQLLDPLAELGLGGLVKEAPYVSQREKIFVVAPGAGLPLREWPYFQELLIALRRQYPRYRMVVVGTAAQAKWHGFLQRFGDAGVEDLVGRTTVEQLTRLCERARLVIANDSGVAHVAASLAGAPTVVLMGPGDPKYIQPVGYKVMVARVADLPCSPCESGRCRAPYGYQRCLKELNLQKVLKCVRQLLFE